MKKNFLFIYTTKKSKIYKERFFFNYFKKRFNTKILTINRQKKKEIFPNKKLQDLISIVKGFQPNYLIVISNYQEDKKIIYNKCKNINNIKLIDLHLNDNCFEQNFENLSKVFKSNFSNMIFEKFFFQFFILFKIIWIYLKKFKYQKSLGYNLDYFFYSGLSGKSKYQFKQSKLTFNVPSFDNLRSYNLKKISFPKKKYILFQDEMLVDHQDIKLLNEKSPENQHYYNKLNYFFDYLEKKFNYEVIISLHPRANLKKSKKLFNQRNCRLHLTAELVKKSEFTCLHASTTSISFPIIFNKKILVLSSNNILKNYNYRFRLELLLNYLNLVDLNIDKMKYFESKLNEFSKCTIDQKKYSHYKKNYLGPKVKKYRNFFDICKDKL